ncbi:MAG: hypothetical protein JW965_03865 [Bacteroidales bacterium]|nr:hypothetical protein [Bacteroidales bacterium]
MKTFLYPAIVISVLIVTGCSKQQGTEYNLYYLGGQSNMEGYGYCSEIPDSYLESIDDILIFHGNTAADGVEIDGKGIWSQLKPGHGGGFSSNGNQNNYSDRFGCELSFAVKMKELNPGSKIALLKYAKGGSSIDEEAAGTFGSWDPQYLDGKGINQYDHSLAAVDNALSIKDIDGDGKDDRLIPSGIIWMQGESDAAFTEEIAKRYYDNLSELINLIRQALGDPDLPVVIGRISDSGNDPSGRVWEFGETVRKAQHQFAQDDPMAAIVTSTDNYSYSDPWHYDSEAYIDLGNKFALALDSLVRK